MFDDLMFPNVPLQNWQMMPWERIALTGLLSRIKPKGAIEIGVYHGGSLSLTSQYVDQVVGIDIDPEVPGRFANPPNAAIWVGASVDLIPRAYAHFAASATPVNFVLIDADHTATAVRRDIDLVLDYVPGEPMVVVIHDSGNPDTRHGILSADWSRNPHLHFVDLDFVPGQIIEHSIADGRGEVWGGLALAYLDGSERVGAPSIRQSARTSLACLHRCAPDLRLLAAA